MFAYVFWHWKQPSVGASDYELRQRSFHKALAAAPSAGFHGSFSAALEGAPWASQGGEAYEDWYLVESFAALGELNQSAVSASRTVAHDAAAAVVADGAGGVYGLRLGAVLAAPHYAYWFGKPAGIKYETLFAELAPVVAAAGAGLWMRQMVLGPAREFCLHATTPVSLPPGLDALAIQLRPIWPDGGGSSPFGLAATGERR